MKRYVFALLLSLTNTPTFGSELTEYKYIEHSASMRFNAILYNKNPNHSITGAPNPYTGIQYIPYDSKNGDNYFGVLLKSDSAFSTIDSTMTAKGKTIKLYSKNNVNKYEFPQDILMSQGDEFKLQTTCQHPDRIVIPLQADRIYKHTVQQRYELYSQYGTTFRGTITCAAEYEQSMPIKITLVPNIITLTGPAGAEQHGATTLQLSGESKVAVSISNPYRSELIVSFDKITDQTTASVSLTQGVTEKKDIYVRAVKPAPGQKSYNILLQADYI